MKCFYPLLIRPSVDKPPFAESVLRMSLLRKRHMPGLGKAKGKHSTISHWRYERYIRNLKRVSIQTEAHLGILAASKFAVQHGLRSLLLPPLTAGRCSACHVATLLSKRRCSAGISPLCIREPRASSFFSKYSVLSHQFHSLRRASS